MIRILPVLFLSACGLAFALPTQRVGQPLEIKEIYIPGGEVKPKPRRDRKPPLSVRVLEVKPAKDGHRYDFEVQGLEPGDHDLADYLDAPEGTVLPAIPLVITSGMEPGVTRPHPIETGALPDLGGYRALMTGCGVAWLAGLAAILFWRKPKAPVSSATSAPPTVAERLRPLLDAAAGGTLTPDERAKLERLLIGHWRDRLPEIAALPPAEAMARLRMDPQASPLILALEKWLHAREATMKPGEIEALLAPYQNHRA